MRSVVHRKMTLKREIRRPLVLYVCVFCVFAIKHTLIEDMEVIQPKWMIRNVQKAVILGTTALYNFSESIICEQGLSTLIQVKIIPLPSTQI